MTLPGSDSRVGASVSQRFPDESLKEKKRERERLPRIFSRTGGRGGRVNGPRWDVSFLQSAEMRKLILRDAYCSSGTSHEPGPGLYSHADEETEMWEVPALGHRAVCPETGFSLFHPIPQFGS